MGLTRVSIIGSAGRLGDGEKMNRHLFNQMVRKTESLKTDVFGLARPDVILVSGGSAWADHVAVRLWLESVAHIDDPDCYAGLRLFLPCGFDACADNTSPKFCGKDGEVLNTLHMNFTEKMKGEFDSRADIACAHALGAELNCCFPGFHNRNRQVAQSEYVIAFTWSDDVASPKPGGSKHTWDSSAAVEKIHVPLSSLQCNNPIISAYNTNIPMSNKGIAKGVKRKEVPT